MTFDEQGVSGHPNHIATFRGVRAYQRQSGAVPALALASTPLWRKYIGLLDSAVTLAGRRGDASALVIASPPAAVMTGQRAMKAHASQLVWFRRLYIIFSRFMAINELVPIAPPR